MSDLLETLTTKEAFDAYWDANYVPVTYEDVKEAYEGFVLEHDKKIFLADYQEKNCITREDFIENLHEDAAFLFQDALTESFYDKNPEIYETAFALYEMAEMEGRKDTIAVTFHETYNALYWAFMLQMYDHLFA